MESSKEHPVILRVMRLMKPSMINSFPIPFEEQDLFSTPLANSNTSLTDLGSGEFVMLPQSFGNIFLGEVFVSYLSVKNESEMDVASVSIKVDLQTGSQRIPLAHTQPVSCLPIDHAVDEIISHEVKEIGTHILVCIVSYKRPDAEVKTFRKFFKFQVLKPLDVITKFFTIKYDEAYLEVQIKNLTQSTMCIDRVDLDPSQMYTVTPLHISEKQESIFGNNMYLKPSEVWQYLFLAKLKPSCRVLSSSEAACVVGKLEIEWKSSFGEKGRLHTSSLSRSIQTQRDVRLVVNVAPAEVTHNNPFTVKCSITNYSERSKNLQIGYENITDILWLGVSGQKLKTIPSKESFNLDLNLLPISPGIQVIGGLRLLDAELNRMYDFDDIYKILVQTS